MNQVSMLIVTSSKQQFVTNFFNVKCRASNKYFENYFPGKVFHQNADSCQVTAKSENVQVFNPYTSPVYLFNNFVLATHCSLVFACGSTL